MGFFSAIGSALSSVGSFISSGIRSVASGISSAVSGAISALGNFAGKAISTFIGAVASKAAGFLKVASGIMTGPLGPILGPIVVDLLVKLVVKVISKIAEENEVVEKNERPEEIGYRLEEADKHEDWKRRDEFKSFKEYYAYLKEQIPAEEIDRDNLQKNFGTYSVLGMQAEVQAIEEKIGLRIPKATLVEVGRSAMEFKEVQAFIRAFDALGYKNLNISEYLKGTLPAGELERITAAVLDALKFYFPEKTERDLLPRLNEMRRASEDDKVLLSVYKEDVQAEYGAELQAARQSGELPKETEKILEEVDFKAPKNSKVEATR